MVRYDVPMQDNMRKIFAAFVVCGLAAATLPAQPRHNAKPATRHSLRFKQGKSKTPKAPKFKSSHRSERNQAIPR